MCEREINILKNLLGLTDCFLRRVVWKLVDNMSNWLGFSLSPHLRIDEGFGRETQDHGGFPAHLSVMPLRSDGSLCAADPFRRSNGSDGIVACELSTLPEA